MKQDTVRQIHDLIEPLLAESGHELVEVQLRNEKIGLVLRIIIYQDSGITLEDCQQVSREVSHLMEVEDPIGKPYNLEVSSPGLDRPLITARDYVRNIGKKIQIWFSTDKNDSETIGVLKAVENGTVTLTAGGQDKKIILETINKAKPVIEF